MNTPIISIVMPVYNSEKHIEQCISTILNQTLSNFELICVDDGSTDNSGRILEKFAEADKRVRLIRRLSSSGSASLPRNIGLEKSTGRYVIFLDSDDFFDSELLHELLEKAEKSNADIVMCDSYNVFENEISTEHTELHYDYIPDIPILSRKIIPNKIFQISNAAVWHRLFNKEFLEKSEIEFQLGVPSLDDVFFVNATLAIAEKISFVKKRLIYYRKGGHDAQTSKIDMHHDSIFFAFKALNDYLIRKGIYEEVKASLQTWTISTMKWWLGSLKGEDSYHKLLELYRNEYIPKLMLAPEKLSDDLAPYWKNMIEQMLSGTFPYLCSSFLRFRIKDETSVVVYGAGDEGKKIVKLIEAHNKAKLSLWLDKNVREAEGKHVYPPEAIKNKAHDIVLVAINNPRIAADVKKYLIMMGESEDKIYTVIE